MSRYPEEARQAAIKCIGCNAPVVRTVAGTYVCVECGDSPIDRSHGDDSDGSVDDSFAIEQEPSTHPAD